MHFTKPIREGGESRVPCSVGNPCLALRLPRNHTVYVTQEAPFFQNFSRTICVHASTVVHSKAKSQLHESHRKGVPRIKFMGAVDFLSIPTSVFGCCVIEAGIGYLLDYRTYMFGTLLTLFNLAFPTSLLLLELGPFLPQGLIIAFPFSRFSLLLDLMGFPHSLHSGVLFKGHLLRRSLALGPAAVVILNLQCLWHANGVYNRCIMVQYTYIVSDSCKCPIQWFLVHLQNCAAIIIQF